MIQFVELELTNFAIYPSAAFRFSIDPQKPLTVIRGENESGKTTLMRAFLWVLFGAEGLQEQAGIANAIRPVWAGVGQTIETKVKLQFRVSKGERSTLFNLVRRLTTTNAGAAPPIDDRVVLSRQDPDGSFRPQTEAGIHTLQSIIRPEMKDFYFIDADKAVDFVGGTEGNHNDQLMRRMIGKSIRTLLSIDELRAAAQRVESSKNGFIRQIATQGGGGAAQNRQQELQRVEQAIDQLRAEIPKTKESFDVAAETHRQVDEKFSSMLQALERASKRGHELKRFRDDRDRLGVERKQLIHQLGDCVPGPGTAALLVFRTLTEVIDRLEPMKEQGHIPPSELDVIPRLFQRGQCLCGTPIVEGSAQATELQKLCERAKTIEEGARFLDAVLGLAVRHRRAGNEAARADRVVALKSELAKIDPKVYELSAAIEKLEGEMTSEGGGSTAAEIKRDVEEKLALRDSRREQLQRQQVELEKLESERRSLQEAIRAAAGRGEHVRSLQAAVEAARLVASVLKRAHENIEREQVNDVSLGMTRLFGQMVGLNNESLVSAVGLRAVHTAQAMPEYELFAQYNGVDKPLILINGASRRALSVAFVLSLAEQTGTRVPLVTDSLLHSTSGEVRRRLVEFLASGERVGQPIMFGTRADFHAAEVRSVLATHAGATYTLTAQSHVGSFVVRADPQRQEPNQVSVCRCSPSEYCQICERIGDSSSTDLKRAMA